MFRVGETIVCEMHREVDVPSGDTKMEMYGFARQNHSFLYITFSAVGRRVLRATAQNTRAHAQKMKGKE